LTKKKKTRRRFTEELKAETVKLVKQSDRSKAGIAMELGISAKSISEWVRKAEESGDTVDEDERAELKRLRKEVRELWMERGLLAKATAFFAIGRTSAPDVVAAARFSDVPRLFRLVQNPNDLLFRKSLALHLVSDCLAKRLTQRLDPLSRWPANRQRPNEKSHRTHVRRLSRKRLRPSGAPAAQRSEHAAQRSEHANAAITSGSPGRTRTCDKAVNSRLLYQLSYRGTMARAARV
jgi:transposase